MPARTKTPWLTIGGEAPSVTDHNGFVAVHVRDGAVRRTECVCPVVINGLGCGDGRWVTMYDATLSAYAPFSRAFTATDGGRDAVVYEVVSPDDYRANRDAIKAQLLRRAQGITDRIAKGLPCVQPVAGECWADRKGHEWWLEESVGAAFPLTDRSRAYTWTEDGRFTHGAADDRLDLVRRVHALWSPEAVERRYGAGQRPAGWVPIMSHDRCFRVDGVELRNGDTITVNVGCAAPADKIQVSFTVHDTGAPVSPLTGARLPQGVPHAERRDAPAVAHVNGDFARLHEETKRWLDSRLAEDAAWARRRAEGFARLRREMEGAVVDLRFDQAMQDLHDNPSPVVVYTYTDGRVGMSDGEVRAMVRRVMDGPVCAATGMPLKQGVPYTQAHMSAVDEAQRRGRLRRCLGGSWLYDAFSPDRW